jgi:hypothetical protein
MTMADLVLIVATLCIPLVVFVVAFHWSDRVARSGSSRFEKPDPLATALMTLDQFLLDPDVELKHQFAVLEKQVAERERVPTEQADGFT